jgi:putative nucleotidyltransferase with HDIG domain
MIPAALLDGIERLEPLPITLQKMISVMNHDNVELREIIRIVEYDGAITSNILRIANSAAYGGTREISHVRDALVRLGTTPLLNALLMDYARSISTAAPMFELAENELWLHGAAASLAAKAMVEAGGKNIPASAAIAALLHDIGKLIMVRYLKADVSTLHALCKEKDMVFIDAERALFGCDHAEVGGAMARKWNFPEDISLAIEMHHQLQIEHENAMMATVTLANLTAKSICVGLGAEGMNLKIDFLAALRRLDLSVESFERVCIHTHSQLDEIKKSFGMGPANQ